MPMSSNKFTGCSRKRQAGYSISIGTMGFRESSSSLKFLLIPATFWHRLARCKLTKPSLEGHFTNACAVWTT